MPLKTIIVGAACALTASAVQADTITFTHEGSGSGDLNGNGFGTTSFIITAVGDTTNRQSFSSGYFIDHDSAMIDISGVGSYTFLTGTRTFVNNSGQIVGFSRAGSGGADLFNGPSDAVFAAWDMLSDIGPVSGLGSLLQWTSNDINTDGGILNMNGGSTDVRFTAVIPAPGTLALLSVAGLSVARRRR